MKRNETQRHFVHKIQSLTEEPYINNAELHKHMHMYTKCCVWGSADSLGKCLFEFKTLTGASWPPSPFLSN